MSHDENDPPTETGTKKLKRRRATFPFDILPDTEPQESLDEEPQPQPQEPRKT